MSLKTKKLDQDATECNVMCESYESAMVNKSCSDLSSNHPRMFCKKGFLRNFAKNSQENTYARVSF